MNVNSFVRGAVLAPPITFIKPNEASEQTGIRLGSYDEEYKDALRFAAFYFDLAIIPKFKGALPYVPKEEKYLIDRKFARLEYARFVKANGGSLPNGDPWPDALSIHALENVLGSRPRWSIVDCAPDERMIPSNLRFNRLELEILGQFPIPSEECSLRDILKFSGSNRKSLQTFRNSVFGLATLVDRHPSPILAQDFVKDEISRALEVISREASMSLPMKYLKRIKVNINLPLIALETLFTTLGAPPLATIAIGNSLSLSPSRSSNDSLKLAVDAEYLLCATRDKLVEG